MLHRHIKARKRFANQNTFLIIKLKLMIIMAMNEKTKGIVVETVRFVLTVLSSILGFNLIG
jgi:type VI protein secretion system component Hcp